MIALRAADRRSAIVVTEFRCPRRFDIFWLLFRHYLLKGRVLEQTDGLQVVRWHISWRSRTFRTYSVWSSVASIYSMGKCESHVEATRMPSQRGIVTSCNVFVSVGEWMEFMFG